MGRNLVQKILEEHFAEGKLAAGEEVGVKIDQTLTQDATGTLAYLEFEAMGVDRARPEVAPALLKFFQGRDIFARTHVISFWHPVIKALREQEPRLRTGVLLVGCPADPVGLARAALAEALVLHYGYVTPDLVDAVHEAGLLVYIWNIDDVETVKPYLAMNLDGIGSNRPDVLVEYIKSLR